MSTIIYAGKGSFEASVNAIEERLRKAHHTVMRANETNFLTILEKTEKIRLIILPPGNAGDMRQKMRNLEAVFEKIELLYNNKTHLLAICAGVILLSKRYFERHATKENELLPRPIQEMGLSGTTLIAPFVKREIVNTKQGLKLGQNNIQMVDIKREGGQVEKALNIMGPIFAELPNHRVLARYQIEVVTNTYRLSNPPSAILIEQEGCGKMILEANHSEFSSDHLKNDAAFSIFDGYPEKKDQLLSEWNQVNPSVFESYLDALT